MNQLAQPSDNKPSNNRSITMKTTTRFLQAATLIAITLTFSCSSDDSSGGNDPSNGANGNSSSSSGSSKCNQTGIIKGPSVTHGGETYESVVICGQTWLARDLNYEVEGLGSICFGNDPANCRLYDWSTAMVLDQSCNSEECADQIQPKHRGICPSGWHIPNDNEWITLVEAVGGLSIAGSKLKARNGWADFNGESGNGTDDFGFSAMPKGSLGVSDDWLSTEEFSASEASSWSTNFRYSGVTGLLNSPKSVYYSVRCLKD